MNNRLEHLGDYARGNYSATSISRTPRTANIANWFDRLALKRVAWMRRYGKKRRLVDLCCGNGTHLLAAAPRLSHGIGIDAMPNFLAEIHHYTRRHPNIPICFSVSDARLMPIATASIDTLSCFSALYAMPDAKSVMIEIGRVLRPGGVALIELGNSHSLAQLVANATPGAVRTWSVPHYTMSKWLQEAGLQEVSHQSMQILPLWGRHPTWLRPLLHRHLNRLLTYRFSRFHCLDDLFAALLKPFAFRHVFLCSRLP